MKSKLFILGLFVLGAGSCQTESPFGFDTDPSAVRLNAGMNGMLMRSNPLATDEKSKEFNPNDEIKVLAGTQSYVTYYLGENGWMPKSPGTYLKWESETMNFKAVYPATATITDFTLPEDQSSDNAGNAIALADYMVFDGSMTKRTGAITIPLVRKMARVIVNIQTIGVPYAADAKLTNVSIFSPGAAYTNSNVSAGVTKIKPHVAGDGSAGSTYTALVIPTLDKIKDASFIELTAPDGILLSVKEIPVLYPGFSYTYNLSISKQKVEIKDIKVEPWGTENPLTPGGGAELVSVNYEPIPAGDFLMGSSNDDTYGQFEERPQHRVYLTFPFMMSKYEITNAQYCAFLNACKIGVEGTWKLPEPALYAGQKLIVDSKGSTNWGVNWDGVNNKWVPANENGIDYSNYPVINVTWYGAKAFAQWVGGDLPTEAQWEFACRAGKSTPWSTEQADGSDLGKYAWYNLNADYKTHAVGTKAANGYGLYDMHGNVAEWCNDWYAIPYKSGEQNDPIGPSSSGSNRVIRGGNWNSGASGCRSAYRGNYGNPANYSNFIGFRVVVSVLP